MTTTATGRLAIPLRCRSWHCPLCAPRLRRRLTARTVAANPRRFITLTTNPRAHPTPEAAYAALGAALVLLVKRIRRAFPGAPFEYLAIWERTRQGWPHLHMVVRGPFVPQPWLSHQWAELTGAQIVDIRQVRTQGGVAAYLAKYLTKDPHAPAGTRRFRASNSFFAHLPPKPPWDQGFDAAWSLARESLTELEDIWRREGLLCTRPDPHSLWAVDIGQSAWLFDLHHVSPPCPPTPSPPSPHPHPMLG